MLSVLEEQVMLLDDVELFSLMNMTDVKVLFLPVGGPLSTLSTSIAVMFVYVKTLLTGCV